MAPTNRAYQQDIEVALIDMNLPLVRRTYKDEEALDPAQLESLDQLGESMEDRGTLYAITISRSENGRYNLAVGLKRLLAARRRNQEFIPAVVIDELTPQEAIELSLVENLQREDLTPFEEAYAFFELVNTYKSPIGKVAERIRKDQGYVRRRLKLLSLPPEVQEMLANKKLNLNHADVLASLPSDDVALEFANTVVEHSLSEGDLLDYIQQQLAPLRAGPKIVELGDRVLDMSPLKVSLRIKRMIKFIGEVSGANLEDKKPKDVAAVVDALRELRDAAEMFAVALEQRPKKGRVA